MRSKPLIAAVVALMLQACHVTWGRAPGDVTLAWTFVGDTCAAANVTSVHVAIPGESLANGGVFPCTGSNGYPEVKLTHFYGGQYTYTIEGLDSGGYTTHVGSGAFTVDGDILETVDLTPVGQPTSFAYVTWTFPGNATCASAEPPHNGLGLGGVAFLDISLDGAPATRLNCLDGSVADGANGISTPLMDPGSHTIDVSAVTSNSFRMFRFTGTFVTQANHAVSNQVDLAWAVGGAVVGWTLANGSTTESCTTAGDPIVVTNFHDVYSGVDVYPAPGDAMQCAAAPVHYYYLPAAATGTSYDLDMYAYLGGITWDPIAAPPSIIVTPGVFPADTTWTNVILRRN